jgi:hypothetical protein
VPPAPGPELGLTLATFNPYENLSAVVVAEVPNGVTTVTSTTAGLVPCPGDTAVIEFGELITKELAGVLLNATCDASDNEFPVIVT